MADARGGFIFDGFPRTLKQADALGALLARLGQRLDAVIEMQVDDDGAGRPDLGPRRPAATAARSITTRPGRSRPTANAATAAAPTFTRRADDNAESLKARLMEYYKKTSPLIGYYYAKGKLQPGRRHGRDRRGGRDRLGGAGRTRHRPDACLDRAAAQVPSRALTTAGLNSPRKATHPARESVCAGVAPRRAGSSRQPGPGGKSASGSCCEKRFRHYGTATKGNATWHVLPASTFPTPSASPSPSPISTASARRSPKSICAAVGIDTSPPGQRPVATPNCWRSASTSTPTCTVEGDLRREVQMNIKRLMDLGCYRGLRHRRGLPVRGQRTHTNARTRKGPAKPIAGKKK